MGAHWVETAARHWRHGRIVGHRFAERGPGIRAALRAAKPGSALLAGNSHAELVGTPDLGGRRCINIAVGGSTAADRGRHLAALRVPAPLRGRGADHRHQRHPALAASRAGPGGRPVRGRCPGDPAQPGGLGRPGPRRGRPADRGRRDRPGSRRRRGLLGSPRGALRRGGHAVFDPFAAWRAGTEGLAGPGLHRDGVHLADCAPLAAALAHAVAIDIGVIDAAPPAPVRRPAAATPLRVLRAARIGRP
ncbi:SGNH/GDSL hydrolase family protein [Methylobacterium oryzae CBMB20]